MTRYTSFLFRFLAAAIIVFLLYGCAARVNSTPGTSWLIIKNIHIVDVERGIILPNKVVVIKDKMIWSIGHTFSKSISHNARTIDGTGKYLSPGLWDMHAHVCWAKNNDTLLFSALLKNGVTGVRDMGGDLGIMQDFKKRVKNGQVAGPDIYGSGPMIDGYPPVHPDFTLPVDDRSGMQVILDSLKTNGADFFKVYSLLKENQLKTIAAYCETNHFNFSGHLSEYIEPAVSISLGQKTIEHLNRLDLIWEENENRMESIGRLMISKKTFLCPTLITYQLKTKIYDSSIIKIEYAKYIPAPLMNEWNVNWAKRKKRNAKEEMYGLEKVYLSQMSLVGHLHKMGVQMLAGSDFAGMPYVYPGIGLQEELILFVKAGLTNTEALRTATINPALCLGKEKLYGSVVVSKYADLVLLDGNPLDDIKNMQTIHTVILKGEIVYPAGK